MQPLQKDFGSFCLLLTLLLAQASLFPQDVIQRKAISVLPSSKYADEHAHGKDGDKKKPIENVIDQELELYLIERHTAQKNNLQDEKYRRFSFSNIGKNDIEIYKVEKGDHIFGIAKKYNLFPSKILENNPKLKRRPLYIGETIFIPKEIKKDTKNQKQKFLYYGVRKGDTLYSIANKYKVSVDYIKKLNRIQSDMIIHSGQKLKVKKNSKIKKNNSKTIIAKKKVFYWPLKGKITSGFGRRVSPFSRSRVSFHKGIDISAKIGTSFRSTQDGVVIRSRGMHGYGNCIFILHPGNYISVYAHNKKNLVKKNQIVRKGEVIGLIGATGAATGPHLHFEVRKFMKPIDPIHALQMTRF